ncbi:MAG TPA: ATP-dependent DNA ligase [Polyangiales bacterium]
MLLRELAELSRRLSETKKRTEKTALIAALLRDAESEERGLVALYLAGSVRQPKLGVGYAQLASVRDQEPSAEAKLSLHEVDAALEALSAIRGAGSAKSRQAALRSLLAQATREEQSFLAKLMLGELRQGALESLLLDAIAAASHVSAASVRRAQMLSGDLRAVVEVAFSRGEAGLAEIDLTLFRPVQPMLAEPAVDPADAIEQLGRAILELKLDGARVQVHRRDEQVRVYTRALNEVTDAVPELVELVRGLPARELVLDGEVIALRDDGSPLPFQETMRRFGRKVDIEGLQQALPLSAFFFDCLHIDGESMLNAPTEQRVAALTRAVPLANQPMRIITSSREEAEAFFQDALGRGHEGVMAKALDAPYVAGSRGASWLKLKQAHTFDLVVLAAEWGSGRRQGWLSNLHLGARDPESGGFVMLGKTFKGLTDELLRWQTEQLLARETHRDDYTVYVRPELVVEIALNDVQTSPHYPAGLALRFARVKRYRPDKAASEADTVAQLRALHARSQGAR